MAATGTVITDLLGLQAAGFDITAESAIRFTATNDDRVLVLLDHADGWEIISERIFSKHNAIGTFTLPSKPVQFSDTTDGIDTIDALMRKGW